MNHEMQGYCRYIATTLCHKLKLHIRQCEAISFHKNDSHFEVYLYELRPNDTRGTYQGCCKWSAIFHALCEVEKERKEQATKGGGE